MRNPGGLGIAVLAFSLLNADSGPASKLSPDLLAGSWIAILAHEGETRPVALRFEPHDGGEIDVKMSVPAVHVKDTMLSKARLEGDKVVLWPGFTLAYD